MLINMIFTNKIVSFQTKKQNLVKFILVFSRFLLKQLLFEVFNARKFLLYFLFLLVSYFYWLSFCLREEMACKVGGGGEYFTWGGGGGGGGVLLVEIIFCSD